jgi:hypothetical protein
MSIPRRRDVSEEELQQAGQVLLDAAYAYWKLMQEAGQGGALFWLDDSAGKTVLFTRGEYRATLLRNVDQLRFEGGRDNGSALGVKVSSFHLETSSENGVERADDRDLGDDTTMDGLRRATPGQQEE